MSLRLYFLRHGETTYSRTGAFCGELDAELTQAGLAMAKAFAESYRTLPWTAIYVSPMKRTIATAKPLCDATGLNMHLRDGLKEIRYGEWEDKTHELAREQYPEDYINWLSEPAWNAPTGGETAVEIANRAMPVITEIRETYESGSVLVVSHKATIRVVLCSLLGIDLGRYRDRIGALAASVSVVKFDRHGPLLEVLGDRSYMSEELRNLPGS